MEKQIAEKSVGKEDKNVALQQLMFERALKTREN